MPCFVQHQAGCGSGRVFATSSFSNRPKKMFHTSPSLGGSGRSLASHFIPLHGKANSTVQPLSTIERLLSIPSTCTADRKPGKSQSVKAQRTPRGCVPRQKFHPLRSSLPPNHSALRESKSNSGTSNLL